MDKRNGLWWWFWLPNWKRNSEFSKPISNFISIERFNRVPASDLARTPVSRMLFYELPFRNAYFCSFKLWLIDRLGNFTQVFLWKPRNSMPWFSRLGTWTSSRILFLCTTPSWNWYSCGAHSRLFGTWGATRLFVDLMIKIKTRSAIISSYCHA